MDGGARSTTWRPGSDHVNTSTTLSRLLKNSVEKCRFWVTTGDTSTQVSRSSSAAVECRTLKTAPESNTTTSYPNVCCLCCTSFEKLGTAIVSTLHLTAFALPVLFQLNHLGGFRYNFSHMASVLVLPKAVHGKIGAYLNIDECTRFSIALGPPPYRLQCVSSTSGLITTCTERQAASWSSAIFCSLPRSASTSFPGA